MPFYGFPGPANPKNPGCRIPNFSFNTLADAKVAQATCEAETGLKYSTGSKFSGPQYGVFYTVESALPKGCNIERPLYFFRSSAEQCLAEFNKNTKGTQFHIKADALYLTYSIEK